MHLHAPHIEAASKGEALLPLYGITPFTMLDYPDHMAAIVWLAGCNMRCGYCQNPEIVRGRGKISLEHLLYFLRGRQDILEAVVFSGGEASLYPDLPNLLAEVKMLGFKVKLDTNGTQPERLKKMISEGLIDYVALDYKAPEKKYKAVTKHKYFEHFSNSLTYLCTTKTIPFEVRTTVHTDLLQEDDLNEIISDLRSRGYQGSYYIQNFTENCKSPTLGHLPQQSRMIQKSRIQDCSDFEILYRNFDGVSS